MGFPLKDRKRAFMAEMTQLAFMLAGWKIPVREAKGAIIAGTNHEHTGIWLNVDNNVLFEAVVEFYGNLLHGSPDEQMKAAKEVARQVFAVGKGLIDHEIGHVRYTDGQAWEQGVKTCEFQYPAYVRIVADFINMYEDHRVNRCMAVDFPGSKRFIRNLYYWQFIDYEQKPDEMPPIAWISDEAHVCLATGKSPATFADPDMNKLLNDLLVIGERVRRASSTQHAVAAAFEALELMMPYLPEPQIIELDASQLPGLGQPIPGSKNPKKAPDSADSGDYRKSKPVRIRITKSQQKKLNEQQGQSSSESSEKDENSSQQSSAQSSSSEQSESDESQSQSSSGQSQKADGQKEKEGKEGDSSSSGESEDDSDSEAESQSGSSSESSEADSDSEADTGSDSSKLKSNSDEGNQPEEETGDEQADTEGEGAESDDNSKEGDTESPADDGDSDESQGDSSSGDSDPDTDENGKPEAESDSGDSESDGDSSKSTKSPANLQQNTQSSQSQADESEEDEFEEDDTEQGNYDDEPDDFSDLDETLDAMLSKEQEIEHTEREQREKRERSQMHEVSENCDVGVMHERIRIRTQVPEVKLYDTSEIESMMNRVIPAMESDFQQLLEMRKKRWRNRQFSGSVDRRRMLQEELGDDRIFRIRNNKKAPELVVVTATDESASMEVEDETGLCRFEAATGANYLLHEILRSLDIPHQQFGFSATNKRPLVVHRPYVLFENCSEDNLPISCGHFHNARDALSIRVAAETLRQRPERDKLLIIISDGQPYHPAYARIGNGPYAREINCSFMGDPAVLDTRKAVEEAEADGIQVVGVSIGDDSGYMEAIYSNRACVNRLSQLPAKLVDILAEMF